MASGAGPWQHGVLDNEVLSAAATLAAQEEAFEGGEVGATRERLKERLDWWIAYLLALDTDWWQAFQKRRLS